MRLPVWTLLVLTGAAQAGTVESIRKQIGTKPETAVRRASAALDREDDDDARDALDAALADAWWAIFERDGAGAFTDLGWFLDEFPNHPHAVQVRAMQADAAARDAARIDQPAVWTAIARTFADTPAGVAAAARARRMLLDTAVADSSIDQLRTVHLAFPGTSEAEAAWAAEQDLAWKAASAANSPETWRAFIDRYPAHPHATEARAALVESSWTEGGSGRGTASAKWRYADEFGSTPRGWEAAVQAMEASLLVRSPDGVQLGPEVSTPLATLTASIGHALPAGYTATLEVSARRGESFAPWMSVARELAPALGVVPSSLGAVQTRVTAVGGELSWQTPLPICSVDAAGLAVRVEVVLRRDGEEARSHRDLNVTAPCPGERRVLFLQQLDSLAGPVAHLAWDVPTATWRVTPAQWAMQKSDGCAWLTSIDEHGPAVACGPVTARYSWDGTAHWRRLTDTTARSSVRLPVEAVTGIQGITVDRGQANLPGGSTLTIGSDLLVTTPSFTGLAFGSGLSVGAAVAQIPSSAERPSDEDGLPRPENASVQVLQPAERPAPDARSSFAPAVIPIGTLPPAELGQPAEGAPLVVGVLADRTASALLLPSGSGDGWTQVLRVAATGRTSGWESLTWSGAQYLRTASVSTRPGYRLHLTTIRWGGDRWVADEVDLP